ncbi:aspartate aminotransferase-like [Dreissena polymorpha]|uniref:aspartate aminotransferase-like n=1 Tax=Dreissena polymorpha TaxID=45954 RepID=UPI0022655139|nr:aspartate aminotransferase-like [Dreissena polymorpha]
MIYDLSKDQLVRKTLENYSGASNLMHNEKVRELMAAGKTIYHFGFGQSPFPIMSKAAERLSKHASKAAYLPVAGFAICDFHKRYDDISRSPDDVIVGPGSKELIFLLMNIFEGVWILASDTNVIIPSRTSDFVIMILSPSGSCTDIIVISPSWTSYTPQVQLSQHTPRVIVANMADEWKITPASFKQFLESENFSKVKLLILNNPDTPTGTLYTKEELISLRDVCRQHKVIVLADEIYARLTYADEFTSMARVQRFKFNCVCTFYE